MENQMEVKPDWLIIDALNLAYRGYHSLRDLKTTQGVPSGLEFGMLKSIQYLARNWYPAKLVIVWDGKPEHEEGDDSGYKMGRDRTEQKKDNFYGRCDRLRECLSDIIETYYHPQMEADYVIAMIVSKLQGTKAILSTDDDYLGLVDYPGEGNTVVVKPAARGVPDQILGNKEVVERFGVEPERLSLYRAFAGDKSDNLPGVRRVPEIMKVKAVQGVDLGKPIEVQVDEVIARAKVIHAVHGQKYVEHRAKAIQNYRINDLRGRRSATLAPEYRFIQTGSLERCHNLCRELEMVSLIERQEWKLFNVGVRNGG